MDLDIYCEKTDMLEFIAFIMGFLFPFFLTVCESLSGEMDEE